MTQFDQLNPYTRQQQLKELGWKFFSYPNDETRVYLAIKGNERAKFKRGDGRQNWISAVTYAGLVEDMKAAGDPP
jgi:hypothetical protein